ncbi:MAG: NFACT RNA binding domain-containing protein [Ignavibacteriaceae bacterium]
MFKNYFFLNRFIIEANEELKGFSLSTVFTQDKDKLILEFKSDAEEKYLEISANPGFPYVNLRRSFHRAKKNTIDFYSNVLPSPLLLIDIAERDRIIRITANNLTIYFTIRGKFTNIFFVNSESGIEAFKKNEDQDNIEFLKEVNSINFISVFNMPDFDRGDCWTDLRKKHPILGKEIITEAQARSSSDDIADTAVVKNILNDIIQTEPAVFIDEHNYEIHLAVNTFKIFSYTSKEQFDNLIRALNFFFGKYFQLGVTGQIKRIIKKHIERELGKVSSKLNNLKSRIDNGSKEVEYNKLANLLLINLNKLRRGMDKIEIEDIYSDNTPLLIKLNEKLSPQKNADYYFDKSKSEKINYNKSMELFESLKKQYNKLKGIEGRFNISENIDELNTIMKELKIKTGDNTSPKDDLKEKFKQYIIYEKYNVFVGKDSSNNDLLTTKFAKQNDYWFHARSVPGSHVVLRIDNTKEAVPKDVLKKTASIAAYHSKAKTSGMAPVSYAQKKYVVKKKGMEPGKVALLKEDVLIVRPEIPDGCEYVGSERE